MLAWKSSQENAALVISLYMHIKTILSFFMTLNSFDSPPPSNTRFKMPLISPPWR